MNKYLSGDMVKPKKYFYALRPILACRWIENIILFHRFCFDDLVKELLPDEMKDHVSSLHWYKGKGTWRNGNWADRANSGLYHQNIQELDDYVQSVTEEKKDWKALNQFSLKN